MEQSKRQKDRDKKEKETYWLKVVDWEKKGGKEEKQLNIVRHIEIERETDRHTDRQTDRQKEKMKECERYIYIYI